MINVWRNRGLLKLLYGYYRVQLGWRNNSAQSRAARRIRSKFYLSVWQQAAERFDARVRVLSGDILEIQREDFRTRVLQNDTPLDDYVRLKVAGDKPLTYRLLDQEHIRTAPYEVFQMSSLDRAADFLRRMRCDCVVKPARGWGGVGVTTGVWNVRQLYRATAAARVFGPDILVQQQIPGDCYRLVYLDGELLDAVVRRRPSITADGKSTIAAAVSRLNQQRLEEGADLCQALLTVDLEMKATLAKQGWSLTSKPPAGTVVQLKTVINDNCSTENATALPLLCQSIVDDGAASANALGIRLAGVDIITPNPRVPLAESGGAVIEVNTAPGHYWHYHKQDGAFPLADHILAAILAEHPECGLSRTEIAQIMRNEKREETAQKVAAAS